MKPGYVNQRIEALKKQAQKNRAAKKKEEEGEDEARFQAELPIPSSQEASQFSGPFPVPLPGRGEQDHHGGAGRLLPFGL